MVFLQVLMAILEPGDRTIQVITVLQSIVLIFQSFEIITFWYQSRLESRYVVLITTVTRVVAILYKVAILLLNKSVEWFAFSSTIDFVLVAVALYFAYRRSGGQKMRFSLRAAKELLSECYPYIVSGVMSAGGMCAQATSAIVSMAQHPGKFRPGREVCSSTGGR
jgi:hypothetical protein